MSRDGAPRAKEIESAMRLRLPALSCPPAAPAPRLGAVAPRMVPRAQGLGPGCSRVPPSVARAPWTSAVTPTEAQAASVDVSSVRGLPGRPPAGDRLPEPPRLTLQWVEARSLRRCT